ncbi:MAG: M3 family metallopeptidase [Ignavibacteria bacterium]|nr:M3 family metallopeptidase [Ignavibacteria bacterium]MCU7501058.1 M3 family metallopeptidase [Ignavibacteria bacterium]MCU7514295.1 M3 family metallopeptidase [Ignavibacteria bacterium]MCU7522423.1 M3 family metallopeptidase [Ignavibacteria bacterium]
MKFTLLALICSTMFIGSTMAQEKNPFFSEYKTPFQVPPFDKIKEEHYLPAFKEGIKQQQKEIKAIINNKKEPTFENTILALERSGELLTKVGNVYYNAMNTQITDNIQKISREVTPLMAKNSDDINLNEKLFQRVKAVYDKKDKLKLNAEQMKLLEKTYKDFVRGGANLAGEKKEEFRKINTELSMLSLKFGENVLKENNTFELVLDKKEDLAGLPESVIAMAADAAKKRGHEGKWVFTLHVPSITPFLQYSDRRDLREKIYKAYINKGNNNNELDNKAILSKIASLRVKRANLLGFKTHADYVLDENMAKTPDKVYELLNKLWTPALERAKMEAADLQKMAEKDGQTFKIAAWDWWYYAEKLRKEKYDLDDETLRPYFKLDNVRQGAFDVAHKLYGITFTERKDLPVYNKDVKAFEVKEADGSHVGILYVDYFPRNDKRSGAWMNGYRDESKDGKKITPIVVNAFNFTAPAGDKPALLTFEEVSTLFHEFGHALHGLLANTTYKSLSGTAVARDFVELPSQIMENWAGEPEVIKSFAKHYQTGETIPDALLEKIKNTSLFNQGFMTVEYLAASLLDMDWHTIADTNEVDAKQFEDNTAKKLGLIPEIAFRYRSPYFSHIFNGGYSSGYYSYIWAEVLDSDAFEAFKEKGLFDQATAKAFRDNVLSKGATEEPMVLYKRFRGQDPSIEPLLKKRGLVTDKTQVGSK